MTKVMLYKSCGEMFYEAESDILAGFGWFWPVMGCFGAV